jgi:hypothetical protein
MLLNEQSITNERGIMKKVFTGVVSGALILGSLGMASTAAQAYDREAFAHAASHFVGPNQLPKIFASKPGMSIEVQDSGKIGTYVCTSAVVNGPDVQLTKSVRNSFGFYNVIKKDLGLTIYVNEYRNNVAAEKAFAKLTKDIKKCDGDYSGSWTDEDGTVYPYQNIVTSGKIPAVTVTGVESIFTNQNSNNAAVGDQPAYLNDSMSIFTLVNDAIILTQGSTGSALNLTAPQKKALEQVANRMVTAWVS